jgi:uncharacterized protein (DUF927 family)
VPRFLLERGRDGFVTCTILFHRNHHGPGLHGDVANVCNLLAGHGLNIQNSQSLVRYLRHITTQRRVTSVGRTGWHTIAGKKVFVLGDEIFGASQEAIVLGGNAINQYGRQGTLEQWQMGIGALSKGQLLVTFSISCAFAGPLLRLAEQEGGGIHFFGRSSSGKSKALLLPPVSVWAGSQCVRSWRATSNGLEGIAAASSDVLLALDEVGANDGIDIGESLYTMANGAGKQRATRCGEACVIKDWRLLFISSGEVPIEIKLAESKRKPRAGQFVRLIDVPVDRGKGCGVLDFGDASLVEKFAECASQAYGTAGPEFIRRLLNSGLDATDIRKRVKTFVESFVPQGSDGQVSRAAGRIGLIAAAGELATEFGIVPWQKGDATKAAEWVLQQWISQRGGTAPAEDKQAVAQVRLFIETNQLGRFNRADEPESRPINNFAGYKSKSDDIFLIFPEVFRTEVCRGLDPTFVARTLANAGFLVTNSKLQIVHRINGRQARFHGVSSKILEGGDPEE